MDGHARFSETIDLFTDQLKLVSGIAVVLLLAGATWLALAGQTAEALLPVLFMITAFGTLYIVLSEGYVYRVRDDGVHFTAGYRDTAQIPIDEITEVTRTGGMASELFTDEEAASDDLVTVGCDSFPAEQYWLVSFGSAVDQSTRGGIRIDTLDGRVYVFATNRPRQFADAVERAREATSAG